MKTTCCLLLVTLSLAACGEPPTLIEPGSESQPANDPASLPPDHPPIGGARAGSAAQEEFSASGTVTLKGLDSIPASACVFVSVRGTGGALWLTSRVGLADEEIVDGACSVPFDIDETNTMMMGPRPQGELRLHVTYNPVGFVEDPDVVAAEPIAVADGDSDLEVPIELADR